VLHAVLAFPELNWPCQRKNVIHHTYDHHTHIHITSTRNITEHVSQIAAAYMRCRIRMFLAGAHSCACFSSLFCAHNAVNFRMKHCCNRMKKLIPILCSIPLNQFVKNGREGTKLN
jgi:hypothetical protein